MPRDAAVERHLDARDSPRPRVGRRPGDGQWAAADQLDSGLRRRNGGGRRCRVRRLGGRREGRFKRPGLGAHVCEEIDHRLLHPWVGRAAAVRIGLEAVRPVHGSAAEDERAARSSIEAQVMRLGNRVARVEVLAHHRGRRQVEEPGRSQPIVGDDVPLVAERAVGEACCLPVLERRDTCVSPEAHLPFSGGHEDRPSDELNLEELASQLVLGPSTVGGRAEPRVTPIARPLGTRVDFRVRLTLLVTDQRSEVVA